MNIQWNEVEHYAAMAIGVLFAVNTFAAAIPAENMESIEKGWPRVANALRLMRALGPDPRKAILSLLAGIAGRPYHEREAS